MKERTGPLADTRIIDLTQFLAQLENVRPESL